MTAEVLLDHFPFAELAALHERLATRSVTPVQVVRHQALATRDPDRDLAEAVAAAADHSAERGQHDLASELFLLAAERCPADCGLDRGEWLTRCIEEGVIGHQGRIVGRAVRAVADSEASHEQSVRVKIALLELGTQRTIEVDEVLAASVADAEDDPALRSLVYLQKAKLLLTTPRLAEAEAAASRSAELARQVGDTEREVEALTVAASIARGLGDPRSQTMIERAVRLSGPVRPGNVHVSARYIAARFAIHADDLEHARQEYIDMLARVGRDAGYDRVHVLRSLVDVVARQGRGREALALAERAYEASVEFGLPSSAGWYSQAVAEATGGSFVRVQQISHDGIRLAEEREDDRYLRRHLACLGQAQLHLGELDAAAGTFRRLVALDARAGLRDLTGMRWHADAVSALVAAGALGEAAELLQRWRERASGGASSPGVDAALDRAEADLAAARGDLEAAGSLAAACAHAFAELGQPIEQARALVALAHVERRRRRAAPMRAAIEEARRLLVAGDLAPWLGWLDEHFGTREVLASTGEPQALRSEVVDRLSPMERQIAERVAAGSTNREIAAQLHLSIKTVEGSLTRTYRKLGVRSRTQLAAQVLVARDASWPAPG